MKKFRNKKYNIDINNMTANKICRLCCLERISSKSKNIFVAKIREMVEKCSSLRVSEDDGLPTHICRTCLLTLTKFYAFRKNIERTDKILKKKFGQIKSKQDILDIALNKAQIESYNEHVYSDDVSFISPGEVGSIKPQVKVDNFSDINSNEDVGEILEYFIESADYKGIKLIKNNTLETNSVQLLKNSEKTPEIIEGIIKEQIKIDEVGCDKVKEMQQNIIIDLPPLIPLNSKNTLENNIVPPTLLHEPPPLVPLKPMVNKAVLLNITKVIPNLSLEGLNQEETVGTSEFNVESSNSLICNICKKEFKERKKLIGHLKGHTVTKVYGCKICGKGYPNPSTFQIHMRTHTGERPFKCSMCNKGFVRWAGVMSHMQSHANNRPFKCDTCDKSFKISSNLERHKILHSGILPFCCNYCGKTFSQSDNLQLHIRTYHTNERPYLCSQCGKGFVSSTRLNRHMWVHSGYKPFRCKQCAKAYSNSSDLKNHERCSHGSGTNEKTFACNFCDMRFFYPCRLSKHLKTHQRPYACSHCNKTFNTSNMLEKHMDSKHLNNEHSKETSS